MKTEFSTLTGKGNFFEDFNVGDVYEHARGKTVEALENVLITNLVLNTAQAHFNEDLAQSLEQKHRITFGGVTASLIIGLAMQDTGENAIEEIGLDKVRFRVPVLHGDTLYAFTEVINKEDQPADTRGYQNVGLIQFRHWGVNQRGETVFEGERRVLVKKRAFVPSALERAGHGSVVLPSKRTSRSKSKTGTIKRSTVKSPVRGSKSSGTKSSRLTRRTGLRRH
jgi:itaconyl-CoA hydratase